MSKNEKAKKLLFNLKRKKDKKVKVKKTKEERKIQILKYITLGLAILFVIEAIYFGIRLYINRKNSTYYSSINDVLVLEDSFVAVGLSDSKNSKNIKFEKPGYIKPYIWVYDEDLKIEKEIKFDLGYNGEFTDIIEVEDGYVVVGCIEMTKEQHEGANSEGMIIKYDKEFNIVWRKNLDILGDTTLNEIKVLKDGNYIVAGSSLYPSDVIGNHTHGGAILVKYSTEGEKLETINYGGPKTGEFNDFVLVDDGIIAVGVRSNGTGIIFKYDFKGKEVWHNYYGYTDSMGLTSIEKISDNEFIVTGSKLEEKNNTDSYQAAILKFNKKGKLVGEQLYQKSKITRFNDTLTIDDTIYAIGVFGQKVEDALENDSVVVSYSKDLNLIDEKKYEGDNTYTLNNIVEYKDSYLLVGHTDSKIKKLKSNGLDYYPVIEK